MRTEQLVDMLARHAGPAPRWAVERRLAPASAVGLALVVSAMAAFAMAVLGLAPDGTRLDLLLGWSWASCPGRVAILAIPALAVTLWAMRGLAPTRPRLAGFAAGTVAGSLGALGYALYCPELSPLFVLVWYSLGILVPACIGAALGPWVLRW